MIFLIKKIQIHLNSRNHFCGLKTAHVSGDENQHQDRQAMTMTIFEYVIVITWLLEVLSSMPAASTYSLGHKWLQTLKIINFRNFSKCPKFSQSTNLVAPKALEQTQIQKLLCSVVCATKPKSRHTQTHTIQGWKNKTSQIQDAK